MNNVHQQRSEQRSPTTFGTTLRAHTYKQTYKHILTSKTPIVVNSQKAVVENVLKAMKHAIRKPN